MKKKTELNVLLLLIWAVLILPTVLTAIFRIYNPNFENFKLLNITSIASYLLLVGLYFIEMMSVNDIFIKNWILHFVPSLIIVESFLVSPKITAVISIIIAIIMVEKVSVFIKIFAKEFDE